MSEDEGFKEPTAPGWMATFGDLMSLLLTFFVLLMSFASMDVRRFAAVVGSMRDAFGVQRIHAGPIEALSDSIVRLSDSESTPFLQVIDVPTRFTESQQAFAERLKQTVRQQKLERIVQVEESARGVIVRVPGGLLFDAGSADLNPNALVFLHEVAQLIDIAPGDVSVEGHTDSTPSGAAFPSNWDLSAARAVSALRHLTEVEGVDPHRLRASGLAHTRPLVSEPTREEREKNRRVEFVFLHPRSESEAPVRDGPTGERNDERQFRD